MLKCTHSLISKTLKAAKRDISYVYPFCNTCDHNMHHKGDIRLRYLGIHSVHEQLLPET